MKTIKTTIKDWNNGVMLNGEKGLDLSQVIDVQSKNIEYISNEELEDIYVNKRKIIKQNNVNMIIKLIYLCNVNR